MATFQGTGGNDRLIGTAGADSFTPLLGQDTVDGGAGADTLTVDYASLAVNGGISGIAAQGGGTFAGLIGAGGTAASVSFTAIESLAVTLTAGSDTVTLDAAPLAAGATLALNGGSGIDTLIADFSAFADTAFTLGVNLLIAADHGSYAGFESFDLALGEGRNTVTLQSGADVVRSSGGVDTLDLGSGRDSWIADFSGWSASISFGFDGDRNLAAISNGTEVQNVETGSVVGGSADDAFYLNGWNGFAVDGGGGRDQLIWDESGRVTGPYAAVFLLAQPDSFQGSIQNSTFTSIEQVNVALGDADNYAFVDTAPLAGGATMNLDGGGGRDLLEVDFSSYADTTFAIDASGTALTSHGTYGNFEDFGMALGGGTNTVTTGAGDDTVYSLGGLDRVDGGTGFDAWGGDYSEHAEPLDFTWNAAAGTATLSNGTTLAGIETGYLVTGAGADVFTLTGLAPFDVYGGAGVDRLVRTDAGLIGATPNSFLHSAGTAFYGSVGNGAFDGIEQLAVTFGDGDDYVYVNAAPLAQGATAALDGGVGRDTLLIDFSAFADTTFTVAANGTITSQVGTFAGFEAFSIGLGGGVNAVTTGGGNDSVQASFGGTNTIRTGAGDDAVYGGSGAETIIGGTGTDTFHATGKAADSTLTRDGLGGYVLTDRNPTDGDQGTDRLTEVERVQFSDSLVELAAYGPGVTFTGTAGADTLTGTVYDDTLIGLAGDDVLSGGDGADLLNAGPGNDRMTGGIGVDTVTYADAVSGVRVNLALLNVAQSTGGGGNDTFTDQIEHLIGSALADTLIGNALDNRITGGAGADTLDGGGGADMLVGGAGNDSYHADNAADTVVELAGEGTDSVYASVTWVLGGTVENLILRGTGAIDGTGTDLANTLTGNIAANTLTGLGGNDRLDGGAGADTLIGGLGNDIYVVDNAADSLVELANEGTDLVTSSVSWTLGSTFENLTLGGTAAINGSGTAAANQMTGNTGNNQMFGLGGADTLSGGAGNDLLVGGAGADSLTGGLGADTFRFDLLETGLNKDTIRDYAHGTDHLELSRSAFAGLAAAPAGQLAAAAFTSGTAATTASHRLIYNQATGALYYDADGVGGGAQVQLALLTTRPILDAIDFQLI